MRPVKELFEQVLTPKSEMEDKVLEVWHNIFKNTRAWDPRAGSGNYSLFIFTLGKDRSEWSNGIWQNDPLNLSFSITTNEDGTFVVAWDRQRLTIAPTNPHMAFSGKKLKLRKIKAKNIADLEKKIKISFNKVKDSIKESLKNGDFDVYSDEIIKIIKSKV